MSRTFVIAEAASAHDGDLEKALRLVEVAARAGADACKFQYWSDADLLADRRRVPPYYREFYRRYAVPANWLPRLAAACTEHGLEFMCTVFLQRDVPRVDALVRRHKVSSFEAGDKVFVWHVMGFGKPVLVSTGMQDMKALAQLANDCELLLALDDGRPFDAAVLLLHCVSGYPAPPAQLQLCALREPFQVAQCTRRLRGFSDHTGSLLSGALAVAAGAEVVEVHMRLADTDPENPDGGSFALRTNELMAYVAHIRQADEMLGEGKALQPCEAGMAHYRVTP